MEKSKNDGYELHVAPSPKKGKLEEKVPTCRVILKRYNPPKELHINCNGYKGSIKQEERYDAQIIITNGKKFGGGYEEFAKFFFMGGKLPRWIKGISYRKKPICIFEMYGLKSSITNLGFSLDEFKSLFGNSNLPEAYTKAIKGILEI